MSISAKRIRLSDDSGSNWYTLPGNTGQLSTPAGQLDDTIFGQLFSSSHPGLVGWSISSNAIYKGYAGYQAVISVAGSATTETGEAMSVVAGLTYRIDDSTKEIWDRTATVTVYDDGSPVAAADIESIDYLYGQVTFVSGYVVTGDITVDMDYLTLTQVAASRDYNLTMTAAAVDETTMPAAQGNNGHRLF